MYEFWYDYVKPKYNEKAKPKIRTYLRRYCQWPDTSDHEWERLLSKLKKSKKVIHLIKLN